MSGAEQQSILGGQSQLGSQPVVNLQPGGGPQHGVERGSELTSRQPDVVGSTASKDRNVGIDITRAVALLGVVTMNFHGYLNFDSAANGSSLANRVFNPWVGVLSTRFAATFVVVAGISIALLSQRSRRSGDPVAIANDRWRLRRRGVVLLAGGFVLNWIWPGTILFFYGAYFIVASWLITLRSRWLLAIGVFSVAVAQGLQLWSTEREIDGGNIVWLFTSDAGATRSPRELVLDIFVNGTHPLFPWLGFVCLGMVLGRSINSWDTWRWRLVGLGFGLLAGGYAASTLLSRVADRRPNTPNEMRLRTLAHTDPFNRSLLYVVVTVGSSLIAVMTITWIGQRFATNPVAQVLRRAGQMTLSIYVLHVLVFNGVVNRLGWIRPTGLDTALMFAAAFWVLAMLLASWWNRYLGQGPFERLYRRFGG
jgi:uncharacterized protein